MSSVAQQMAWAAQLVLDRARTEAKSLLTPVFNVTGYGARGDGSTDDTQAIHDTIAAAVESGGGVVFFPPGRYMIKGDNRLDLSYSNITYKGVSGKSILDFSGRTDYADNPQNPLIKAWGSESSIVATLTVDLLKNTQVATVDSTADFAVGDMVLITSNATWDGDEVPHQHGELKFVKKIDSATQLTLSGVVYEDYTVANAGRIVKIDRLDNIIFEGLTFVGKGSRFEASGDYGLVIRYANSVTVRDCRFEYIDQCCLDLQSVYGFLVENNTFVVDTTYENQTDQSGGTVVQYGCKYSNASESGLIQGNVCHNGRHGIVQGHTTAICGITRHVTVQGNSVFGTWHAGISTHNSCEFIEHIGNSLHACRFGINLRTASTSARENHISGCNYGVYLSQKPANLAVVGNTIVNSLMSGILLQAVMGDFVPENIQLHDNQIDGAVIGINISLATSDLKQGFSIQGNRISNCSDRGISMNEKFTGVVSRNVIRNVATRQGIYTRNAQYQVITDNHVENCVGSGITVDLATSSNCIIKNNVLLNTDGLTVFGSDHKQSDNVIGSA